MSLKSSLFVLFSLFTIGKISGQRNTAVLNMEFSGNHNTGNSNLVATGNSNTYVTDREGNNNCALKLNGNQSIYLTNTSINPLDFEGKKPHSISIWYKPEANYTSLFLDNSYYVSLSKQDFGQSVGSSYGGHTAVLFKPDWNNIICVSGNDTALIYINGVVGAIMNQPTILKVRDLVIGKNFIGSIDQIKIFDFALTKSEVFTLYKERSVCSTVTNLENLNATNISDNRTFLHPNPATDIVILNNNGLIEIYDNFGNFVKSAIIDDKILNISDLKKGIYIVKFFNNQIFTNSSKFIKE